MRFKIILSLIGGLLVLPSPSSSSEPPGTDDLYLRVYPENQVAREHQNIAFDCRDEGNLRAPIHWRRGDERPFPSGAVIENGRLAIYGVKLDDAGVYICEAIDVRARIPGQRVKVVLDVESSRTPIRSYDSSRLGGPRKTHKPHLQIQTGKLKATETEPIATDPLNLKIYPEHWKATENHDAISYCRDEGNLRSPIRWLRAGNLPLPTRAVVVNGRLTIRRVQLHDAGDYICEAIGYPPSTPGQHVKFTLGVEKSGTPVHSRESSQAGRSNEPTETNPPYLVPSNNLVAREKLDGTGEYNLQIHPEIRKPGAEPRKFNTSKLQSNSGIKNPLGKPSENNLPHASMHLMTEPPKPNIGAYVIIETGVAEARREPPKTDELYLRVYPERQVAREHQNVVFNCRDEGNLRAPIQWRREDELPLPSGAVVENGRLTIYGAKLDAAGVYICEAIDSRARIPGQRVKVVLDVRNPQTPIRSYGSSQTGGSHGPRETHEPHLQIPTGKLDATKEFIHTDQFNLKIYPDNRKAVENHDVIFDCRAEGNIRAPIRWLRGNNLPLPTRAVVGNGRLTIRRVQLHDAGDYICEAMDYPSSTPGQHVKSTLEVAKSGTPVHNHESSQADRGDEPEKFDTSKLQSNLGIKKPLRQPSKTNSSHVSIYLITEAPKPNIGAYVIIETGGAETRREPSEADELYLKVYPERQVIKEHQNVAFHCRDEGNLRAPIQWRREDKLPLSSGAVVENGRLTIYGAKLDDAGVYICEAIDSRARIPGQQVKVVLDVRNPRTPIRSYESSQTGEPRETHAPHLQIPTGRLEATKAEFTGTDQFNLKIYPEDRKAIENHDATFDCLDEGNLRASVRWLRGNNLPLPTRAVVANGRLKIRGVQLHDAGEYICEARDYPSSIPGQHVKFTLEVEKSETPAQSPEPSRAGDSNELHLQNNTGRSVAAEKPGENYDRGVNLKISPQYPLVKEHSEATLECYDDSNLSVSVRWWRRGNVPLPSRAVVTNGRLTIHDVHLEDAGFYTCEAIDYPSSVPGQHVDVILLVETTPIDYVRTPSDTV